MPKTTHKTVPTTTIIVEDKQLRRLMMDKVKYKKPYYKIIEGYQKMIEKLSLREELDQIMKSFDPVPVNGKLKGDVKDTKTKDDTVKQPKKKL